MMLHEKLNKIIDLEKLSVEIKEDTSWLTIENILQNRRLEKYALWLTTGKIIPEAGQISPALAHNGLMKII